MSYLRRRAMPRRLDIQGDRRRGGKKLRGSCQCSIWDLAREGGANVVCQLVQAAWGDTEVGCETAKHVQRFTRGAVGLAAWQEGFVSW